MTVPELLTALRECGATVAVDGNELVVNAPRGAVSVDLRAALVEHKPGLLVELKRRDTPDNIDQLTEWPGEQPAAAKPLPPVHDTDDPWAKPTAPCMVCGQARWRVWCHDERKVWQWICNGCRPLVVINPDGTRWRS